MVKIGKWTLFEKTKATEKFKAGVDTGGGGKPKRKTFGMGEHSWLGRCKHFDKLAQEYPLFNQSCLSIAGMCTAQGLFYQPAVNKKDETYPLAEEAMYRVAKVSRKLSVTSKFYNTVYLMAKHGGCFWEGTTTPEFDFRLVPFQEYIEPEQTDDIGNVVRWRQVINGSLAASWPTNPDTEDTFIVHVPWNMTSATWPYGTSLGVGSETELEALIEMEGNSKDYMDKQAWPYEVLALGNENSNLLESDYTNARSEWKNRQPGEGIVTRNMTVDIKPGGTGSQPIRELATLCQLMKDNVHDGLMVPPISKLYNSTEASATVLTQHIMTVLGQPIQWIIKEAYEESLLKPYLERSGFSRKSCPIILFESPDVHKEEEGAYWVGLVQNKIQTPAQACEHLGLEYDEEFWKEQEEKQLEQFKMKAEQSKDEGFQKKEPAKIEEGDKRYTVIEHKPHNPSG